MILGRPIYLLICLEGCIITERIIMEFENLKTVFSPTLKTWKFTNRLVLDHISLEKYCVPTMITEFLWDTL